MLKQIIFSNFLQYGYVDRNLNILVFAIFMIVLSSIFIILLCNKINDNCSISDIMLLSVAMLFFSVIIILSAAILHLPHTEILLVLPRRSLMNLVIIIALMSLTISFIYLHKKHSIMIFGLTKR